MSQAEPNPSPAVPRRTRSRAFAVPLFGAALLAAGVSMACWFMWPVPSAPPPTLDLAHMDPAVASRR